MRLLALLLAFAVSSAAAIETKVIKDVPYKDDVISQTPYEQERCKLDLTVPVGAKGFATYVYFYGGGLKKGSKDLASEYCTEIRESLAQAGIAVVTPDYRLSPKVKYPAYVDDPNRLKPHGLTLGSVAGIAQVSAQVLTHYTIREERGQPRYAITSDDSAPAFYIRKTLPPILTIYAQNDMLSRAEENQFFVTTLKAAGHAENYSLRVDDRDHGTVGHDIRNLDDPARLAILNFIAKQSANR